jgi:hypothetical protein
MTQKAIATGLLAAASVSVSLSIGHAQGTDGTKNPAIGTWKLNLAQSKYDPGPPPKSQTHVVEPFGANGIKLTAEGVAADGSRVAYSYTSNNDGKDNPYVGVGAPAGQRRSRPSASTATRSRP